MRKRSRTRTAVEQLFAGGPGQSARRRLAHSHSSSATAARVVAQRSNAFLRQVTDVTGKSCEPAAATARSIGSPPPLVRLQHGLARRMRHGRPRRNAPTEALTSLCESRGRPPGPRGHGTGWPTPRQRHHGRQRYKSAFPQLAWPVPGRGHNPVHHRRMSVRPGRPADRVPEARLPGRPPGPPAGPDGSARRTDSSRPPSPSAALPRRAPRQR